MTRPVPNPSAPPTHRRGEGGAEQQERAGERRHGDGRQVPGTRSSGGSPSMTRWTLPSANRILVRKASSVPAPTCGVSTTLSRVVSGCPGASGSGVKTSSPAPAMRRCAKRLDQGVLVDHAPARDVDQVGARLHLREERPVDHVPRLVGQRHVADHHVRLAEEPLPRDQLDAAVAGPLLGREADVGIAGEEPHAEAERPLGGRAPRAAEAEEAERLALEVARQGAQGPLEPPALGPARCAPGRPASGRRG